MLDDLLYESCSEDEAFPNRRRQCRGKFFRPRINFSFVSKVGFFLERFNIITEEVGLLRLNNNYVQLYIGLKVVANGPYE
jgi:hypothetical protein